MAYSTSRGIGTVYVVNAGIDGRKRIHDKLPAEPGMAHEMLTLIATYHISMNGLANANALHRNLTT
jgi:hypothetical protein